MDKVKALIRSSPIVIALIYIVVGFLWIQFSDQWVLAMFDDPESITRVQSLKGWFFVAASGFIIFLLVSQNNRMLGNVIRSLDRTNKKFESTIENAPVGIAHHKINEKWLEVNQSFCNLFGYERDELLKLGFDDIVHPDDLEKCRELDKKLVSGKIQYYEFEIKYIRKDGSIFPGFLRKAFVNDNNGSSPYIIAILEDISSQKNHAKQIRKSLRDKEILLSEVHHRVKNNLALISALLNLQDMHFENKELNSILSENKIRIKCLALIHETFSQNENSADINFRKFLNELSDYLLSELAASKEKVTLKKNIQPLNLNINIAIPVSLIYTELMIKNLSDTKLKGNTEISISAVEENEIISLVLKIPVNQNFEDSQILDPENLSSIIINTLAAQIEGSFKAKSVNSILSYSLTFSKKELRGGASHLTNQDIFTM